MSAQDLIGTWQFISLYAESLDGERLDLAGDSPRGMLMYFADGDMSAIWMRRGRAKFASNDPGRATPEELQEAWTGFDAYCGTYTVDEGRACVTHHLEAARFPNWEGTDQPRYYHLSGKQFTITTDPMVFLGKMWKVFVVAQRR